MRIATALGLVSAIVVGLLIIGQTVSLQGAVGPSISGPVQELFGAVTIIVLIMVAAVTLGSCVAFVVWALRR
ncbi:MAG: hypothetical protein KatS3mg051_2257 [Anaerolineae bacterium]|nr:MAG: hypothetical protein KatS3mg051_2257 [Anaerolineae bacterium]